MLCRSAKIKFLPVFFSFLEVMGFPILVRHTLLQVSSDYYCMIFQVLKWLRLSSISRFLSVTATLILAPSDHHQHHPTLQSLPQTFRLLSPPSLSLGKVYIYTYTPKQVLALNVNIDASLLLYLCLLGHRLGRNSEEYSNLSEPAFHSSGVTNGSAFTTTLENPVQPQETAVTTLSSSKTDRPNDGTVTSIQPQSETSVPSTSVPSLTPVPGPIPTSSEETSPSFQNQTSPATLSIKKAQSPPPVHSPTEGTGSHTLLAGVQQYHVLV